MNSKAFNRSEVIANYRNHVNLGMARLFELMNSAIEVDSEPSFIIDETGNRYLDCAGYCVFLLGHKPLPVVKAIQEQLLLNPMSSRTLINPQLANAARELARIAPLGLEYVWFGNSGSEVVEAALKLAKANGKHRWISMEGGYHGKSIGALSVSGRESYRKPFYPLLENVNFVPFGNIDALNKTLSKTQGDAAVILEPLQSEAGVIIPPLGYLKAVSDACHKYGAFLIVDEISTGLGRTGEWWRCQVESTRPDILLTGKSLGGGILPVSALIATKDAFAPFNKEPLLHTSTFAGNPLACVAVMATIKMIGDGVIGKAKNIGQRLLSEIQELTNFPVVSDVRGAGLLIGIEFQKEHYAADFILELMSRKVLVSHSLNAHKVVRLTPPVTLTNDNIEQLLEAVVASLSAVNKRYSSP